MLKLLKESVLFCISILPVLLNEILAVIILDLAKYLNNYIKAAEQETSFTQIFVMEFANMGLIALILGFDFMGFNQFFLGGREMYKREVFHGFTSAWYMKIGQFVCFTIYMSSFVKNCIEITLASFHMCRRFKDRGCRGRLKKNQDDEFDDEALTKLKYHDDLVKLYTGRKFEGEKAYSRMMQTVFVIFTYSSGMPILYLVGAFFCTFTYIIMKFLLLKYYRRSTTVTRTIPMTMMKYLKFALILHIVFSLSMLTQSQPFQVAEKPKPNMIDKLYLNPRDRIN